MDTLWISTITVGMFPISFAFALQYAHLTAFALQIGISEAFSSLVWLCGPVTGLIIQPLIGQLSDRCQSKYGRRRPFILTGALCLALAQLTVAFCTDIGSVLGDWGVLHNRALAVFIISFWVYDAANNIIAVTFRALLSDIVPQNRIQFAFSLQQIWSSLGYISGYFVSQVRWFNFPNFLHLISSSTCPLACAASRLPLDCPVEYVSGCFDVKASFLISAAVTICCTVIVCLAARETRSVAPGDSLQFWDISSMSDFPEDLNSVYLASLLSWFGWFSALIYQVNFVSREVAGTSTDFETAERSAFFGLMCGSILSAVTSLFIPRFTKADKSKSFSLWGMSCGFLAVVLGLSPLVAWAGNLSLGVAWLASFGLVYSVTNSVPYSLVSVMVNEGKATGSGITAGKAMGWLNVAVCVPQTITSIVGGPIISEFHSDIPCFIIGSVCAAGACAILRDKVREMKRGYARAPEGDVHS